MVAILANSEELERLRRALKRCQKTLMLSNSGRICRSAWLPRSLNGTGSHGLESCVDHFAFALKRGTVGPVLAGRRRKYWQI